LFDRLWAILKSKILEQFKDSPPYNEEVAQLMDSARFSHNLENDHARAFTVWRFADSDHIDIKNWIKNLVVALVSGSQSIMRAAGNILSFHSIFVNFL
jgi:hypothetical protein